MGFLYPLFLFAGLAVAIPIAIHLFDLRRFRRVVFPATRFLKESVLRSRRQSRLRERLLLLLRILFILVLVLAFAQPLWHRNATSGTNTLQVIVLDNNPATEARRNGRTLLESGKEIARRIVRTGADKTYLLFADGPYSYAPLSREAAETALTEVQPTAAGKKSTELLSAIQGMMAEEGADAAHVWWLSAFPKPQFPLRPEASLLKGVRLHGVLLPAGNAENTWIDTAFVLPAADPSAESRVVVKSRTTLPKPPAEAALRLTANGRFQSAGIADQWTAGARVDTLAFGAGQSRWQEIEITLADGIGPSFDDTFRIAVQPEKPLPVLVLEDGPSSPYVQTALQASGRFEVTAQSLKSTLQNGEKYALILFSGLHTLSSQTVDALRPAIRRGVPLIVFPQKTTDSKTLEESLRKLVDVRISGIDTALQTAAALQSENPLITEIFETTPPNMELPAAGWHYRVQAGYGAQGQSILSFRNGDPLLAEYHTGSGKLYLLTTAVDAGSGSFGRSYFFAPMLYAVAVSATGASAVAYTAGSGKSIFIPLAKEAGSREVVKMIRDGQEAVPLQKSAPGGIDIYPDGAISQTGFYTLSGAGTDTLLLAFNASRQESIADNWTAEQLREGWAGTDAEWLQPDALSSGKAVSGNGPLSLWKLSLILALVLLAAETAVLIRGGRRAGQSLSPQS